VWVRPPRWPSIVLACPAGVNPAARPDPAPGQVDEDQAGDELVRWRDRGYRVDATRTHQEPARTAGMAAHGLQHVS
jgi:hypothetical protein